MTSSAPRYREWRDALLLLAIVFAGAACRLARAGGDDAPLPGQYISAETITESQARTAWDALRLNVKGITFLESARDGTPVRIRRRGASSLTLRDEPLIYVDDIRVNDIRMLRGMPASELRSIQVLTGIDATTYYGSNAGDGVILLRTR